MKILCWHKDTENLYIFIADEESNWTKPNRMPTPFFWYVVYAISSEMAKNSFKVGQLKIDDYGNTFMLLERNL